MLIVGNDEPFGPYQLSNMVKKVQSRFKLKKFTVLADKGYYNGKDLEKVKLKVKPSYHVKNHRTRRSNLPIFILINSYMI